MIVKGNPLRLSCPFNPFECDSAVIAGDACEDDIVTCKVCLLFEGVAGCFCVDAAVFFSFDRLVFSGFSERLAGFEKGEGDVHVKVVDIVPNNVECLLFVVDVHWQPDKSAFPERVGVPLSLLVVFGAGGIRGTRLIAKVEIRGRLLSLDLQRESRLRVVRARV